MRRVEPHKGTQQYWILHELKKNGITSLDAFRKFGITSLHRRLTDLREMGYEISDTWHYKVDSDGKVIKRWKVYRLA